MKEVNLDRVQVTFSVNTGLGSQTWDLVHERGRKHTPSPQMWGPGPQMRRATCSFSVNAGPGPRTRRPNPNAPARAISADIKS
ncbi:hypothetical protein KY290_013447 [Solanum tuberosum]|uniref:Uncharacterized protein n=1 Tax=Solanum tuberosum TaxID=4113 RepID=A0ABQ7VLR7_SOLTU|nr:hypothetical protein KY285_012904 [Solanum tuberosum]KAH0769466.1 hypothetical protein KY290_013447 [Solanum tuberosum]